MIHHGRLWQDRLLGEEVAKQFAAVKTKGGGSDYQYPRRHKKRGRNTSLRLAVRPSIPLSSGVVFPGVSIWMYEFVSDGSDTMDWLCRFVKDEGRAGVIDFRCVWRVSLENGARR